MKKIIIKVPQKETDKWSISFNGGVRKRSSATLIMLWVKRHLYAYANKEKLAILVKYDKYLDNETLPSQDPEYLIYATTCFLEDYLSPRVLAKEEKMWTKECIKRGTVKE